MNEIVYSIWEKSRLEWEMCSIQKYSKIRIEQFWVHLSDDRITLSTWFIERCPYVLEFRLNAHVHVVFFFSFGSYLVIECAYAMWLIIFFREKRWFSSNSIRLKIASWNWDNGRAQNLFVLSFKFYLSSSCSCVSWIQISTELKFHGKYKKNHMFHDAHSSQSSVNKHVLRAHRI